MNPDKQYEIIDIDGFPVGYFLDNRFYEYKTSTCCGLINEKMQVLEGDKILGNIEGDKFIKNDGAVFNLKIKK